MCTAAFGSLRSAAAGRRADDGSCSNHATHLQLPPSSLPADHRKRLQVEALMMAIAAVVPHYLLGLAAGAGLLGMFMPIAGARCSLCFSFFVHRALAHSAGIFSMFKPIAGAHVHNL